MQLTELIEANSSLLRVGIAFEFNDARNRVSRQLQKNLDTCEYSSYGGLLTSSSTAVTAKPAAAPAKPAAAPAPAAASAAPAPAAGSATAS